LRSEGLHACNDSGLIKRVLKALMMLRAYRAAVYPTAVYELLVLAE
jgi:hypothetical protein